MSKYQKKWRNTIHYVKPTYIVTQQLCPTSVHTGMRINMLAFLKRFVETDLPQE